MIKERLHPNSEAGTGLVAALIANICAFHKEVAR